MKMEDSFYVKEAMKTSHVLLEGNQAASLVDFLQRAYPGSFDCADCSFEAMNFSILYLSTLKMEVTCSSET
jgi:hypothetical protein